MNGNFFIGHPEVFSPGLSGLDLTIQWYDLPKEGAGFGAYIWSTGATTQTITVNMGGTYAVTVIDGACQGTDTVVVTASPLPAAGFLTVSTGNPQRFAFQS